MKNLLYSSSVNNDKGFCDSEFFLRAMADNSATFQKEIPFSKLIIKKMAGLLDGETVEVGHLNFRLIFTR